MIQAFKFEKPKFEQASAEKWLKAHNQMNRIKKIECLEQKDSLLYPTHAMPEEDKKLLPESKKYKVKKCDDGVFVYLHIPPSFRKSDDKKQLPAAIDSKEVGLPHIDKLTAKSPPSVTSQPSDFKQRPIPLQRKTTVTPALMRSMMCNPLQGKPHAQPAAKG